MTYCNERTRVSKRGVTRECNVGTKDHFAKLSTAKP